MDIVTKRFCNLTDLMALSIATPPFQRALDEDRVQEICAYQMSLLQRVGSFVFIGDIILSETGSRYCVLDGQHRLEAIRRVYCKSPDSKIGLTLVKPNVHFSLRDAFDLINKNTPVPEYVLNFAEDDAARQRILDFRAAFLARYKCFVSKAKSPVRPNINVDDFIDKVVSNRRLSAMQLSSDDLLAFVSFVNVNKAGARSGPIVAKALLKAKKYGSEPLFLTVDAPDYACLDRADYFEEFLASTATAAKARKRPALSKPLRSCVWKSAFGSCMRGSCVCCQRDIEYDGFECGHIISVHNGGNSSAANLRPVCGLCNKSMGSENMHSFCERNGFDFNV